MTTKTSTETVVLVAGRCWDGLARRPSGHTEVVVRGGCVAEVGARVDRKAGRVVDLGGRMLLPGFIDCHVHTTMDPSALLTAFGADAATVIALRALPVLRDLLDRGFTTVRDLATFTGEPITIHLRDALERGLITGPRMLVAPHLISARGAHGDLSTLLAPEYGREIGVLADGPAEVTRAVRAEIRAGADWIKFGATGGFGSPTDDPGQATYTQSEMDALVATAADLGVPCTPHAYGDEGVARAVRAGVRCVEHGFWFPPSSWSSTRWTTSTTRATGRARTLPSGRSSTVMRTNSETAHAMWPPATCASPSVPTQACSRIA
ncbi:amidohydrolase family protein [Streptomyces anandii]|uniref:amidohydrolase family protein n=1 Tax=Streptomyces anandii TaxID=285454 RepID=UPI0036B5BD6E